MSGRGETPDHDAGETVVEPVKIGESVFNDDGEVLGKVRGVDERGFFVTTRTGVERLSIEHARAGLCFGEAELVWRCTECGEMGEIENGFPDTCPNCRTEKENIMYWTED